MVGRRSESAGAKGRIQLSRADVLSAATDLLDAEGADNFTMRRLAAILGTGPATLYWHVRDKDELLQLILEDTVRSVEIPTNGSWRERLIGLLVGFRSAVLPRPALVALIWRAQWNLGPAVLRLADAAVGLLAESGLPAEEVPDAYFVVITYALGLTYSESLIAPVDPFNETTTDEGDGIGWSSALQYPSLARYRPNADPKRMEARFVYGLQQLLEGVEAQVKRSTVARAATKGAVRRKRRSP